MGRIPVRDAPLSEARAGEAHAIATVRDAAAAALAARFGPGPWLSAAGEKGIRRAIANPHQRVLVARRRGRVVGTLTLQTKKPWAIEVSYFTPVRKPIYLVDMAVDPRVQGKGIGHALLQQAENVAREMGRDAIRLDAYDAEAGAGGFYAACGYADRGRRVYRATPLVYFERLLGWNEGQGNKGKG